MASRVESRKSKVEDWIVEDGERPRLDRLGVAAAGDGYFGGDGADVGDAGNERNGARAKMIELGQLVLQLLPTFFFLALELGGDILITSYVLLLLSTVFKKIKLPIRSINSSYSTFQAAGKD